MQRLFVCEFITCGGMRDRDLPASLLKDAELMYQSLLSDIRCLDGLELVSTRDNRLSHVAESVADIGPGQDVWQCWAECMRTADLAWLIAPETDGLLLGFQQLARQNGCVLIGCEDDAVRLTASKYETYRLLREHAIPVVPCRKLDEELVPADMGWIVKPDEGAGSEECYYFRSREEYLCWNRYGDERTRYIQQPFIPGVHASMSVLYDNKASRLLSCNRQLTSIEQGRLTNRGVLVGDLRAHHVEFEKLARAIGVAIPGLQAYVGIDLILSASGPQVIEINPRLTTSYAGLSGILGFNVAGLIIDLYQGSRTSIYRDLQQIPASALSFDNRC